MSEATCGTASIIGYSKLFTHSSVAESGIASPVRSYSTWAASSSARSTSAMARVSASAANPFDGPLFSHRGGFEAGHQLFV